MTNEHGTADRHRAEVDRLLESLPMERRSALLLRARYVHFSHYLTAPTCEIVAQCLSRLNPARAGDEEKERVLTLVERSGQVAPLRALLANKPSADQRAFVATALHRLPRSVEVTALLEKLGKDSAERVRKAARP